MKRRTAWGLGIGCGVMVAAGIVGGQAFVTRVAAPSCPAGWVESAAPSMPGAQVLRACARAGDGGPRASRVALYRTAGRAADQIDRGLRVTLGGLVRAGSAGADDAPMSSTSADHRLAVFTRTIDLDQTTLLAEVYLVAAGHRFGLLNIVHAPDAPFARPERTAAWLNTIEGVSPWGAPDAGPIRARCPDGFEERRATGERAVVRCMTGLGSSRFALLSLSWDEGGLATDADRSRVATAIATRATQGSAEAHVVEGPLPFTLARNVDAMHTRVQTGETVPISVAVVAATSVGGSEQILGLALAEPDVATVPVLAAMFASSGASRPSPWLTRARGYAFAAVAVALGAAAS
ncbi:MAG: hypothetical protein WCJ30_16540, partial [Deltaproteobacteria bacterium]